MLFVTGDKHGGIHNSFSVLNLENFPIQTQLTKKDYVVVLGDFGLVLKNSKEEQYWLNWLSERPWTTLFVDGNHENFDLLNQKEEIEMFGDKVGKVTESIFHLKRGRVYNIDGYKIFTMGGAESIDKTNRIPWVSWWPQEIPDSREFNLGFDNLELHNNKVDFVFSHTCPENMINLFFGDNYANKTDLVSKYFNTISAIIEFKHWYFGHFHKNQTVDKFTTLYDKVERVF